MSRFSNRHLPLSQRRMLAVALSAGLGLWSMGCNNGEGNRDAMGNPSTPAVEVPAATHISAQAHANVLNFPTGNASTSLVQVEQISPADIRAGQPYVFRVRVANLTDRALQSVVVRSSQPDGFQSASAPDGSAAAVAGTDGGLTYNIGALAPREVRTFQVRGVASGQGSIAATYSVSAQQEMATQIPVTAPAVEVVLQGPDQVDVCQAIDWTYVVRNTGTGIARNVTLSDTLPEGLTTTDGGAVVTAKLGDIPSGEKRNVVAHLKAAHGGKFSSAASVNSDAGDAKSNTLITTVHQPRLDLAIKGPEQQYLGKRVTYQLTLTNQGDASADAATLELGFSDNARMVGVSEHNGAALAAPAQGHGIAIGVIPPNSSRVLDATFEPTAGGVMKLDASATARCAAQVARASETRILTLPALLLEAVDVQDPVKVGDNVVYKIKVTNQGTGPDSNVVVTATVPAGETYVSAKGDTDASVNGNVITFAPVASLNSKQAVTWEVVAKATKPGDVQFKVTTTSNSVKTAAEKTETTKLY